MDKDKAAILNENMLLKRRLIQYETITTKDLIWGNDPYIPVLVTQLSPNASPSEDMNYIADNIEQCAHTAIQTGVYPNRQCVNGIMMDVTSIVKLEIERIRVKQGMGQSSSWIGGIGRGSPSIEATAESPGQWIANVGVGGTGGNGGGGSEGGPNGR